MSQSTTLPIVLGITIAASTACSGADPQPTVRASADATPTSTSVAQADPVPTGKPSEPAPLPPPAAGTERLAFDLVAFQSDKVKLRASVDVPSVYAIDLDRDSATLASCRASTSLGSAELQKFWMGMRGIHVHARACKEGETSKACIERDSAPTAEGTPKIEWSGETRATFESAGKMGKNDTTKYEGGAAVYDATTHSVVSCSYQLMEESAGLRDGYAAVCKTLALSPAPSVKAAAGRKASPSDADREDLEGAPDKDKLRATVEGFLVAMGKGDVKAAKKFMMAPADCKKFIPGDAKKSAACKTEVQKAQAMLDKPEVAEWVPKGFQLAAIRLARGEGFMGRKGSKEGEDKSFYEVLATPKGSECTLETPVFVGRIGEEYRIFLPMAAKAEKAQKPKAKKS